MGAFVWITIGALRTAPIMAVFAIRHWAAKVTIALTALLVIFFAFKLGMQWYKVQVEPEQIRVGITFDQAKASW